ncbi:MAG TPA: ATP-binding protein [Candidatus Acidoferrales bacterium]|nr:ATP-binding protein [Candidatus Acidoferrales bacterium]
MPALFYVRLIAFTAGALLYLFLLALIVGHRRPRRFERVLFFLFLAMFLIYAGGLLFVNAEIHYSTPPAATILFAQGLVLLGLAYLPALLVHTHLEYMSILDRAEFPRWCFLLAIIPFYSFALLDTLFLFHESFPAVVPGFLSWTIVIGPNDGFGLVASALLCGVLDFSVAKRQRDGRTRQLFQWLCGVTFAIAILLAIDVRTVSAALPLQLSGSHVAILVAGLLPGLLLVYYALRHNFLELGAQRNLVYALSATFLAVLCLALVRRVSGWLEPVVPPEATAAVLLFVLVIFFEPLERVIGRTLYRSFQQRMDRVQRLLVELQAEAQNGDVEKLLAMAEARIREEFGLSVVRLAMPRSADWMPLRAPGGLGHCIELPLKNGREEMGLLEACSTGTVLVGETTVALEFLAEQMPTLVNHCRLIGEKLRLERELGERERLALVGQMAASISHNLRNPISSMKTVLQALLEERDLTPRVREDCEIVVREMDRLSSKLTQLLRYARPGIRGNDGAGRIAIATVTEQVVSLLRRDAERRNVRLEFAADDTRSETVVVGSEEAWTDVISNLVVNAIEAQSGGGKVCVSVRRCGGAMRVEVVDDGPGVPAGVGAKLFQPFFTTKPSGTGLGLAIVARRVTEMGGAVSWESPVSEGRGTKFIVTVSLSAGS